MLILASLSVLVAAADPFPSGWAAEKMKPIGYSGLDGHGGAFKIVVRRAGDDDRARRTLPTRARQCWRISGTDGHRQYAEPSDKALRPAGYTVIESWEAMISGRSLSLP